MARGVIPAASLPPVAVPRSPAKIPLYLPFPSPITSVCRPATGSMSEMGQNAKCPRRVSFPVAFDNRPSTAWPATSDRIITCSRRRYARRDAALALGSGNA